MNKFIKFAANTIGPTGQIQHGKQKLIEGNKKKGYSRASVFQAEYASTMSGSRTKKLTPYKI